MAGFDRPATDVAKAQASHRGPSISDRQQDGEDSTSTILALQRTAGNAAVSRLLARELDRREEDPAKAPASVAAPATPKSDVETSKISFEAVIGRRDAPGPKRARGRQASPSTSARGDLDAEEETQGTGEVDPAAVTNAFTLPASAIPDAEVGETVALPDVQMPQSLEVVDRDPIAGTITFSPTITQSGAVDPFGATTWSRFNITGSSVTASAGSFIARFTLENPITFNVASTKISIASENDAALTNANFATAASDLTPNMSRQGGKPPRTQFWAEDLTIRHERFHSNERSRLNRAGAVQAETWLSAQTAGSVADVQGLIAQVPGRVITASQAAVGTLDEKESRAYGDGAPSYQARADAIRTKGALGSAGGGYP
jgi:hypothetical protein